MSRPGTGFLSRGGAWVVGQTLLLAAVGLIGLRWPRSVTGRGWIAAGRCCLAAGAVVFVAAAHALGDSFTMFPKPRDGATLARHVPLHQAPDVPGGRSPVHRLRSISR